MSGTLVLNRAWASGAQWAALASAARFFTSASWAPLAIFIEERELSAARDFHWRARVERRSNFELENIILQQNSQIWTLSVNENILPPLKMAKFRSKESTYPPNMLLILSSKYFTRALSERKENFASASWAPLFCWKVSASWAPLAIFINERELSGALFLASGLMLWFKVK